MISVAGRDQFADALLIYGAGFGLNAQRKGSRRVPDAAAMRTKSGSRSGTSEQIAVVRVLINV
jgi:hypothetical protein